jgi:hypothetical protein
MLVVVVLLSGSSLAPDVGAAPLSNVGPVLAGLVAEAKDRNRDQDERVQNIEVLGKWATADVREPLIELLKDPAPEIRTAAAKGLGWEQSGQGGAGRESGGHDGAGGSASSGRGRTGQDR